jgi:hypothetical protein
LTEIPPYYPLKNSDEENCNKILQTGINILNHEIRKINKYLESEIQNVRPEIDQKEKRK